MPHVAFVCPDPAMWRLGPDNELVKAVDIPDCLNCSLTRLGRACHYDYADLAARIEIGYDEQFSPSRFNGCDRELYLREHYNFSTDPAEQTYRVRGTAAHAALEVRDPRVLSEARVYRVLHGALDHVGRPVVVGVKPDAVYPGLSLIADFKTWKYLPRGGAGYQVGEVHPQPVKPAVRRQLSVGAWAWANPIGVQYRGDAFTTLSPSPIAITQSQESLRDGQSYLRQVVPLEDFGELEDWMRVRVTELNAMRSGTEPGYCAEDLRWKCGTCPVRYLCGIPKELYAKKPRRS